jgi:multidrug transporter EmrE-like cation transporter
MGIALVAIIGWVVLQQPLTSVQVLCIALIIGGAIGLSLSTPAFSQAL